MEQPPCITSWFVILICSHVRSVRQDKGNLQHVSYTMCELKTHFEDPGPGRTYFDSFAMGCQQICPGTYLSMRCQQIFKSFAMGCQKICPGTDFVYMRCQQIFDSFCHGMLTCMPGHRFVDMRCQQIFDSFAMGCQQVCPGTDSLT